MLCYIGCSVRTGDGVAWDVVCSWLCTVKV